MGPRWRKGLTGHPCSDDEGEPVQPEQERREAQWEPHGEEAFSECGSEATVEPRRPQRVIPVGAGDLFFYLALPVPWNVIPRPGTQKEFGMIRELPNFLPKFNGQADEYFQWRNLFIARVHAMDMSVGVKAHYMLASLDERCKALAAVAEALVSVDTLLGYNDAITFLEMIFGGVRNEVAHASRGIRKLPEANSLQEWIELLGAVRVLAGVAKRHGFAISSKSHSSYFDLVESKLPEQVIYYYHAQAYEKYGSNERPLDFLEKFISSQLIIAKKKALWDPSEEIPDEAVSEVTTAEVDQSSVASSPPPAVQPKVQSDKWCELCEAGGHVLEKCAHFRKFRVKDRRVFAMARRLCFNCLKRGHVSSKCFQERTCTKCRAKHHSLLHFFKNVSKWKVQTQSSSPKQEKQENQKSEHQVVSTDDAYLNGESVELDPEDFYNVSLPTVPVLVRTAEGREAVATALLRDASVMSFVSGRLARRLQLKGVPMVARTSGIGGHVLEHETIVTHVSVAPVDTSRQDKVALEVLVIDDPITSYQAVNWKKTSKDFPHLKDIDFPPIEDPQIDVLVGSEAAATLMCSLKEVLSPPGLLGPSARLTPLGWVAMGPMKLIKKGSMVFPKIIEEDKKDSLMILLSLEDRPLDSGRFVLRSRVIEPGQVGQEDNALTGEACSETRGPDAQ